jgi:hypothetical protein
MKKTSDQKSRARVPLEGIKSMIINNNENENQ